ncbi:MAG: DNA primase [Bacilli bacterium]|nr:DNA primase [Bacilli bacterium]
MLFSEERFKEIYSKIDIHRVVSYYIEVNKTGDSHYEAICPFHNDSNPSLHIDLKKNIFKCFVCNEGGGPVKFIEKYEHLPYLKAFKKACEICEIDVPELRENFKEKKIVIKNEKEKEALKDLSSFYSYLLYTPLGKNAKDYLLSRQLDDEVIKRFKIGYAPLDNKASITFLRDKKGYSIDVLDRAGITLSSSNSFKDRYVDRIMFPLEDIQGSIVGFSGRRYVEKENNEAKYINSSESEVFIKNRVLYNFKNALETCKKDRYLYVLEGFMDVIALYRAGVNSAVGLMGTALSDEHVKLFKKLDVEIRLCLDSDEAGKSATIKAMGKLYENDIKFKIVHPLDDAKDVDEYLNAFGKDNLNLKLNTLDEPILYSLDYYIKHNYLNSYENKEKFLLFNKKNLLELSSLAKSEILNRLATDLNVQESSIEKLIYGSSSPVKKKTFVYNKDSNKDVSLKIKDFILANNSLRNDDAILVSKLVLLESKILVRIVKNVDFFNMFKEDKSSFIIDYLFIIYNYLDEIYLRGGVKCICEEDYEYILTQLAIKSEETNSSSFNCATNIVSLLRNEEKKEVNYDVDSFNSLLKEHKKNLLSYDVINRALDVKDRCKALDERVRVVKGE